MTHDNGLAEARLALSRERLAIALHGSQAVSPTMIALRWAAQRHPLGLVAAAAGAGAAVVWMRPWRMAPVAAPMLSAWAPQLASLALAAAVRASTPMSGRKPPSA